MATQEVDKAQLIAGLKVYRNKLARELEAVNAAIQALAGEGMGTPDLFESAGLEIPSNEYASLRPQEATARFLREHPGKAFKCSAIAKQLQKRGMERKKNFSSIVYSALRRLVAQGVAVRGERNRVAVFSLGKAEPDAEGATPGSEK